MRKRIDLTGQTFGSLKVLERAEAKVYENGTKATRWLCECKCGKKIIVRHSNLMSKHSQSCGCSAEKKEKKTVDKKVLVRCIYLPRAIDCDDMTKCETCGWNPKNTELREKRLEKYKEQTDEE